MIQLLPPKLQRRGLVFKRKLVTMERVWWVTMERVWWVTMEHVWWVTMIESEGLLICVYEWVTLVYGSYEHVPISYGVVTLLKANGYCRLWWCFNKIDDNLNGWAWYMGHTSHFDLLTSRAIDILFIDREVKRSKKEVKTINCKNAWGSYRIHCKCCNKCQKW